MRFSVEEYGFSKKEVENALEIIESQMKEQKNRIFSLKNENESLLKEVELLKKEKKEKSSSSMDKLKEIEIENKKLLEQKTSQIEDLLEKWKKLIQGLFVKYPFIKNIGSFNDSIVDFETKLRAIISDTKKENLITNPIKTSNDSMRALLEKMNKISGIVKDASPTKYVKIDRLNASDIEEQIFENNQIKPITKLELNENDKFETLMEKFLDSDNENMSSLEKHLISTQNVKQNEFGETGFDLKEAVNPKDDLEEIMKAFDFFTDSEAK